MNVFKLEIDCMVSNWVGMALVAADDYKGAVKEYVKNGLSGEFVRSGEIVFTEDSKKPIEGLIFGKRKVICEVIACDL